MRKAPAQMRHRRICLFQPLSAELTSPFRGIPTVRFARVGRPRCFDVLRTSRWRGCRGAEAPLYVFGGANANSGIQLRLTSFKQDYTVLSYALSYVKVPAYKRSVALISRRWSAFGLNVKAQKHPGFHLESWEVCEILNYMSHRLLSECRQICYNKLLF